MNIGNIRDLAISQTLFPPTTLSGAIKKLGFVQADPIRSPARAEELVFRHRVNDYKTGHFESMYESLDIQEDFLYAHGFMRNDIWHHLHPRKTQKLSKFELDVLKKVQEIGSVHPKDLSVHFGKATERNWWGGKSQKAKMALDRLHYWGYLRISGRKKGIRIYEPLPPATQSLSLETRIEKIVLAVVDILSPVVDKTLNQALYRIRRDLGATKPVIDRMIKDEVLASCRVDGVNYLLRTKKLKTRPQVSVKFLSPFDPVVWDRARFEHIWGWPYRFEAYVPKAKRVRGYYAMPVLWKSSMVGWVNVDRLGNADVGYIHGKPKEKSFLSNLKDEIERMKYFLSTPYADQKKTAIQKK